ncbi:hypothetical protein [Nesterenkonia pannonica]|uniref:hypothetical protein n=1 Tax=Nesterenkonia pannonica TaxID=1548602 RepID=UPI00216403BF|nr:hypothetical protein [Nesterenkonia pannonica]
MAALAPVGLAASAPRFPTVRLLAGILMAAAGLVMVLWAGLSTGEEIDGTLGKRLFRSWGCRWWWWACWGR